MKVKQLPKNWSKYRKNPQEPKNIYMSSNRLYLSNHERHTPREIKFLAGSDS